jgi:rod shape-determining protein MreC
MAIYSVGRKRVIIALLLTSVLLLTLDLQGNPVIDRGRDVFTQVMRPVEAATGVVTTPIERVWRGIAEYDDLEQENQALRDQVDRLIGTQAAAEAAVLEGRELQALYSLPSLAGIDTEVARVVGYAANNFDQVVEINKGRSSGIAVGMPVVNQAGLVGKVTSVTATTARVMLVTDTRYTVAVKVSSTESVAEPPVDTTPSGLTPEQVDAAGTTTTTTVPGALVPGATTPDGQPVPATTLPGAGSGLADLAELVDPETGEPLTEAQIRELAQANPDEAAPATTTPPETTAPAGPPPAPATTTTIPGPLVEKEFGALEGRGRLLLPQIKFVQDTPALAVLREGDLVETAGGEASLAPTGIPVGRVVNRADRPGSGGPLLDVELHADLARLNFVRVLLYRPLSEVGQ